MNITLTARRREDVRVDAFVRAIRRSADCTTACDHQPATETPEPSRTSRVAATLTAGALAAALILGGMLTPTAASAATLTAEQSISDSRIPCKDKPRGLRVLCNLSPMVAAATHAVTPRPS